MGIHHDNCSVESREFCDSLLAALRVLEPAVQRHQVSTCSFFLPETNRFAYLYHKSDSRLATIFLRGDDPNIIPVLTNAAAVKVREKLSGSWAKEFPLFIHLPVGTPASEVAEILMEFSLPLANRKRGHRIQLLQNRMNDIDYRDGKIRYLLSTRYERNRSLRDLCLQEYGYKCVGCNLVLSSRYGPIAERLIHVHHLEPLAEIGERVIDPKTDLKPLCPNCHSVVHLRTPPLTIEELKALIDEHETS